MKKSPLIKEIHRIRQEYAERFDNDLHAICLDAMQKQGRSRGNRPVMPAGLQPVHKDRLNPVTK